MSSISNTPAEMAPEAAAVLNAINESLPTPDGTQPISKPTYIHEQHNHNCQQFFGPITGCIFAMPGANVYSGDGLRGEGGKPSANGKPSAKGNNPSPSPKSPSPNITARDIKTAHTTAPRKARELMTFRTHGVLDANLTLLYQQMVKDGWISPDTNTSDFIALFSGERSEGKVIWMGKYGKGTLVFLFRYMELEEVITTPAGFSLPNILMGHFTDTKGHFLTNLDNGDAANDKAGVEVQEYIKIMKYNPTKAMGRGSRSLGNNTHTSSLSACDSYLDADDLPDYGDGYDPYDHQDLHLHKR